MVGFKKIIESPLINSNFFFPATHKYTYLGVANVAPPFLNATQKIIEWQFPMTDTCLTKLL